MRIQNLAVIFVIIILPITLVLQAYIRNLTNVTNVEARYNEILMSSTYDAVRAYQMNTINNDYSGVNTSRQRDIKASVNSFFNSLATGLHKSGSTKAAMNEYVPALLFNLYDGFYIYGPYNNVASTGSDNNGNGVNDLDEGVTHDPDKIDNKRPFFNENVANTENTIYGVKPFIYYSCEYATDPNDEKAYDITINYTLDNYIAVSGWAKEDGNTVQISGAGYYINGAKTQILAKNVQEFLYRSTFGGDTINNSANVQIKAETLGEYISFYDKVYKQHISDNGLISQNTIPDMNGAVYSRYYRYINYNNTKYYFDDCMNTSNITYSAENHTPPIFTINNHCREYISLDQLITLANYEGWTTSDGQPVTKDQSYSVAANFSDYIKQNPNWVNWYFKDVNPYYYYKKAKNFSDEMYKYLSRINLTASDQNNDVIPVIKNNSFNAKYDMEVRTGEQIQNDDHTISSYKISNYQTKNVFDYKQAKNDPELDSSAFNAHRIDVIAKTVESALVKTVSSLNDYYGSNSYVYEMPTISMNDWYSIANGITVAAFMQGVPIGNYKFFNNYCIIGNTTNKEFVSKDAIYVQPKLGELSLAELKAKTGNNNLTDVMKYMNSIDQSGNNSAISEYRTTTESGFVTKLTFMNFPYVYSTQGLGYNSVEKTRIITQHNPKCGELTASTDSGFVAYRKNDYLIESYEHTYEDYRIGVPWGLKSGSTIVNGGVSGKALYDGYNEINTSGELHWEENTDPQNVNSNGLWYYKNGIYITKDFSTAKPYQKKYINSAETGTNKNGLYKQFVQQINYFPQYGANAYECIVSHNGYKYTYDQILSNDADGAGITDDAEKAKFAELSAAYATCLAREKEAQYKNLDTMNYHRIYIHDRSGRLLSIATRESGEEVGVVAFKGKGNSEWAIDSMTEIPTNYTMPFHDIHIYYKHTDGNTAFGK